MRHEKRMTIKSKFVTIIDRERQW